MKIIITVDTYFPFKDGVQNITQSYAEHLAKIGNEVIVVTTNNNLNEEEIVNGVKVYRFKIITKLGFHFGEINKYQKFILCISKNADLLINVCTQSATTDSIYKIINNINCKKILYMHGKYDKNIKMNTLLKVWYNIRWGYYYLKNKSILRIYENVINIHSMDSATKYLQDIGIQKIKIINNFVEKDILNNKNNDDSFKYFLCVSNYSKLKNQEFIIKSYYLSQSKNSYKLIFIGGNSNRYLERLIKINNYYSKKYNFPNSNVIFLTNISRKETKEYICNSSVFLLGSKVEKVPLVLLEASYCGIPFISTDVGCIRYLPGGISVDNIYEMSYWIDILCNNDKLYKNISKTLKEYSNDNYSFEKSFSKLNEILTNNKGE